MKHRTAGAKHGRVRGHRLHIRQARENFRDRCAPHYHEPAGPFGCPVVGDAPMWRTPRVKQHS